MRASISILLLGLAGLLHAQPPIMETLNANGTFEALQTIYDVTIEVWGGGGGGSISNGANAGGGGGGGAYSRSVFGSIPAGTYTVTVGTGGASGEPGGNGGASSFTGASVSVSASGGLGGTGNAGGAGGVAGGGSIIYAGGNGGVSAGQGNNNGGGGGGGSALTTGNGFNGNPGNGSDGGLGGNGSGSGGAGGNASGSGAPGIAPGGGGGGKGTGNNGPVAGAGASGRVVISYSLQAPLPVELTRFEARPDIGGIALDWQTASELNNESFTVEHSRDGQRFQALATVPGAGSTTLPQTYAWLHALPAPGEHYYRLRQTDYDGSYAYSPLRSARWEGPVASPWQVLPSTTAGPALLRRDTEGPALRWSLLNALGQPLQTGLIPTGTREQSLDLSALPAGMYLLRVEDPAHPFVTWLRRE